MRHTREIMGMPVSVEIVGAGGKRAAVEKVFDHFRAVDERFSTYKKESEISRINRGELAHAEYSGQMQEVLRLAEETKRLTNGYFDIITPRGACDPSGLVKGWAIRGAARLLSSLGHRDFYLEAGGDIQTSGRNAQGKEWTLGIRDPRERGSIVKVITPRGRGVATSGTYTRGEHVYDPHTKKPVRSDIVSLTVIGPDVYEADRFATAAFAMGADGIPFIESLEGFEAYAIDARGMTTQTSGFERSVC